MRHEEVDAAASKELEAWEQSGKVYTLQLLAYLLYSFFKLVTISDHFNDNLARGKCMLQ